MDSLELRITAIKEEIKDNNSKKLARDAEMEALHNSALATLGQSFLNT